ncbi:MAG: hypothetical protein ACSHYF_14265 [Verrucomicrobiaceae bacterium]
MKKGILITTALMGSVSAYTLHEWGTFTSVSGSDGQLLAGLKKEEEKLPGFVHALEGMRNVGPQMMSKGFFPNRPLRNVKIKMETPVIYFYSDHPFQASVQVGFNGGSISQWFPQRSGGEGVPKIKKLRVEGPFLETPLTDAQFEEGGGIDFATHRQGEIRWDVEVMAPDASRGLTFKADETLNWLRPRNPKANVLKVGEEYEDYLFYRGVGNFELPVTFSVDGAETLQIENHGDEAIPFLFVQEVLPDRSVRYHSFDGGLGVATTVEVPESGFTTGGKDWKRPVYERMYEGLTATGLTAEESHGMIQTWWHSYFEQPGLRVFWIVPQGVTEDILPLEVSPAPKELVRVLVGRSEVLRPGFEAQLVKNFKLRNDKKEGAAWIQNVFHRYGIAFQHRVNQLVAREEVAQK